MGCIRKLRFGHTLKKKQGGGWEINVNRREELKAAILQEILNGVEGADKQEDPLIFMPYLPTWAQRVRFVWMSRCARRHADGWKRGSASTAK